MQIMNRLHTGGTAPVLTTVKVQQMLEVFDIVSQLITAISSVTVEMT